MITGLLHLHSALRWVALLLLIITIVDNVMRVYRPFTSRDSKLALFTLITMHIQLLIGLALWGNTLADIISANAEVMKDTVNRFYIVEHFIGMAFAVFFVTVGYIRSKRQEDKSIRHRMIFVYYLVALILVLISIPWPFREVGAGRGWF